MALPKLYEQITWVNNTTPALNEDNLNAMSQALEDIDNRVVDVASTIMEDVPIIEEALKHLDPPIRVEKDYAPIQVLTDAIDKPVIDLKVKVDPVQDLHGYTKPWVGGAGKNKANIADAVVTEAGYVYNNAPLVLPSGTYTFSFESTATSGDYTIVFRDADNTELARANKNMGVKYATFTLASACAKFTLAVSATGTYSHFQIEVGSTATTYEPYTNICPITGHSEANVTRQNEDASISDVFTIDLDGTRYGAVLDVDSGVLTLDKKYVDLGTLSYSTFTVSAGNLFRATVSDIKQIASNSVNPNFICSNYPSIDSDHITGYVVTQNANSSTIDVIDSRYSDTTTFKAAMDGVGLVYELATPQTITLTPTEIDLLFGYNTLFADTGDLSLTYDASGVLRIANAKLDIDTFKSVVAASSDFADFKSRVAAL